MKACTDPASGLCRGDHRCTCCGGRIPQCVATEVCDRCLTGHCRRARCRQYSRFLRRAPGVESPR